MTPNVDETRRRVATGLPFVESRLFIAALFALVGCRGSVPPEDPPSVVVIAVDTLRSDRLGLYGYGRPTTPRRVSSDTAPFSSTRSWNSGYENSAPCSFCARSRSARISRWPIL